MFQWTFSQFWPLGLHSNQLKLWNITFWLKTQRERPCCFPPPTLSDFMQGLWVWEGEWVWWCGKGRRQASPPDSARSTHPGPPPPCPPLSAEARKTWTSIKQQWLSYLFSVFAEPQTQHNQEGLS